MSFSFDGIQGMLEEYEADHHMGMNTKTMAGLLYEYTSGYPFLVSRLCQLMDTEIAGSDGFPDETAAWTKQGFLEAVKRLLSEKNTLFESLVGKLLDYPDMRNKLYSVLFEGNSLLYNVFDASMDTVRYMIDQMQEELDAQGEKLKVQDKQLEVQKEQLEAQRKEIEQLRRRLGESD